MTIKFSLLSQFKSIIGFTIERSGKIIRSDETPAFQRTVDISLGLLFGYVTLEFNLGQSISIEKMITEIGDVKEL